MSRRAVGWAVAALALLLAGGGYWWDNQKKAADREARAAALTGGDVKRGRALFANAGCGGCHQLNGVPQAHGQVGPDLDGVAARAVIAGRLANNPDNLARWIADPQAVSPGTAMPRLGLTPRQARDIAAFLYAQP